MKRVEAGPSGPIWDAWAAYIRHVTPPEASEDERCWECMRAVKPSEGCAEGTRLYAAYRLAKVERRQPIAP